MIAPPIARLAVLALAAVSLTAGVAGGLARVRMRFVAFFYVPLALLHLSLALRLLAGWEDAAARLWGGILNAATLVVFAATLAWSMNGRAKAAT